MKTKQLCTIALFAILIAIGAFIKLPISIVPVTMQTFFVTLAGLVLSAKNATLSVCTYVLVGLLGLPVFASGCGLGYVLQPSFGYLIGFMIATYYIAKQMEQTKTSLLVFMHCCIALLIIYAIGMIYFYGIQRFVYGNIYTLPWMVYFLFIVYLPGDILSIFLAMIVKSRLENRLK